MERQTIEVRMMMTDLTSPQDRLIKNEIIEMKTQNFKMTGELPLWLVLNAKRKDFDWFLVSKDSSLLDVKDIQHAHNLCLDLLESEKLKF